MKTSLLSLLAGTALLGSAGMVSAAEPFTLSPGDPVMLSPTDLDQVTAGGYWKNKEDREHFKREVEKKFKGHRWHWNKDQKGEDVKPAKTSPSGDITVIVPFKVVGDNNIVNVQVVIGDNNIVKAVNILDVTTPAPAAAPEKPKPPKKYGHGRWSS